MKIIQKILAFLTAALLLLFCFACGNGSRPDYGSEGQSSGNTEDCRWKDALINGRSFLSGYSIVCDTSSVRTVKVAGMLRDKIAEYTGGRLKLSVMSPVEAGENPNQIRIGVSDRQGRPVFCDYDYALYENRGDIVLNVSEGGLKQTKAADALLDLFEGEPEEGILYIDLPKNFRVVEGRKYGLIQMSAKRRGVICDGVSRFDFAYLNKDGKQVLIYVMEIKASSGCTLAAGTVDDGMETGNYLAQTVLDMAQAAEGHGKNVVCAVNSGFFKIHDDQSSCGVLIKGGEYLTYGIPGEDHEWWGVTEDGKVLLGSYKELYVDNDPETGCFRKDLTEAASGRRFLIRDGKFVPFDNEYDTSLVYKRHPRSCILLRKNGDIVIFVADGRYNDSAGLDFSETEEIAMRMGAFNAINLDGGGSSQLVAKEEGVLRVVNRPEGKDPETSALRKVATGLLVIAP